MGAENNAVPPAQYEYVKTQPQPQQQPVYQEYTQSYAQPVVETIALDEPITRISHERAVFLRKVMLIVAAQLIFAAGVCSFFYFIEPIRDWMIHYAWYTLLFAFIAEIAALIFLFVVRKKRGLNAIAVALFTFTTAYVLASVLVYYDVLEILEGILITAIIVVACIFYVVVAGPDFRMFYMAIVAISFMMLSWFLWFFITGMWLTYDGWVWYYQIFCLLAVLLFTAYLLFRISIVMTVFPTDEYVLAAVDIYMNIITLFMYVLALFGGRR